MRGGKQQFELHWTNLSLPKLKRLEFHDCRLSDSDLQKLKADLPDTMIERTYSIDEKFKGWDAELERRKTKTK